MGNGQKRFLTAWASCWLFYSSQHWRPSSWVWGRCKLAFRRSSVKVFIIWVVMSYLSVLNRQLPIGSWMYLICRTQSYDLRTISEWMNVIGLSYPILSLCHNTTTQPPLAMQCSCKQCGGQCGAVWTHPTGPTRPTTLLVAIWCGPVGGQHGATPHYVHPHHNVAGLWPKSRL